MLRGPLQRRTLYDAKQLSVCSQGLVTNQGPLWAQWTLLWVMLRGPLQRRALYDSKQLSVCTQGPQICNEPRCLLQYASQVLHSISWRTRISSLVLYNNVGISCLLLFKSTSWFLRYGRCVNCTRLKELRTRIREIAALICLSLPQEQETKI
jgi:hypothetical protein